MSRPPGRRELRRQFWQAEYYGSESCFTKSLLRTRARVPVLAPASESTFLSWSTSIKKFTAELNSSNLGNYHTSIQRLQALCAVYINCSVRIVVRRHAVR